MKADMGRRYRLYPTLGQTERLSLRFNSGPAWGDPLVLAAVTLMLLMAGQAAFLTAG
jgi:hypothetical protein